MGRPDSALGMPSALLISKPVSSRQHPHGYNAKTGLADGAKKGFMRFYDKGRVGDGFRLLTRLVRPC